MKQSNKYFLIGAAVAVFCIAIFANNGIFSIAFASDFLGKLPREIRLGEELGILSREQCKASILNRQIRKADFGDKLSTVLDLVGASDCTTKQLTQKGIISNKKSREYISRAEALEILSRAAIMLSDSKLVKFAENTATNYPDYRVPAKYSQAIAYLQAKFVVKGLPDGTLGSKKRLTLRDSTFLLYRFYEAISADMMSSQNAENISFIDIPLNHPITDCIKNLTLSGAFDKLMLRPSFDGDSFITGSDMTEMITGIFARAGKELDQIRLETIFSGPTGSDHAQRRQLTLALEYLLDSFAKDRLNAGKINYKDITIEQPEYESLLKLAGCGITMGYGDGRFAGDENVTWYETANLFNEIIKYSALVAQPEVKQNKLAEKSDIENFKALLLAKKEKIRLILNSGKKIR